VYEKLKYKLILKESNLKYIISFVLIFAYKRDFSLKVRPVLINNKSDNITKTKKKIIFIK